MERYNLPVGGIEVTVGGQQPAKLAEISAVTASNSASRTGKSTADNIVVRRRPLRYLVTRGLFLIGTFAALGNIPVYSKILVVGENDLIEEARMVSLQESQELQLPDTSSIETYAGHEVQALPSATNGEWQLHRIERGEDLAGILEPLKLTTAYSDLTQDPEIKKTLTELKAEANLLIQVNDRAIKQLVYATGKRDAYIVSLQDGKYTAKWDSSLFEAQHSRVAFTIRNPFHYEASKAGLPISITRQLSKIFKSDVDFRRIAIGDQVSVIFEDFYYQSERIATNDILAAEFNHRGDIHQRIRFTMADGKTSYLKPDSDLEVKQVAFSRTPLHGGRISSGFGTRRHPIFGYRRMHTGTDFAAPRGTPIYATANGKVRFVGRKGGYGKAIELSHFDGITTLYGHMSQYKKGLGPGNTIKRGDVIGYVGSTGSSTGNHVHYEFRVNGKPQNPMAVALPQTGILSPKEVKEFKSYARSLSTQLIQLRETASLDRNVRQQFGG